MDKHGWAFYRGMWTTDLDGQGHHDCHHSRDHRSHGTDAHRREARPRFRHDDPRLRPHHRRDLEPAYRTATRRTSTPPAPPPPTPSPRTAPRPPRSAPSSSKRSPTTSRPSGDTLIARASAESGLPAGPDHRRGRPHDRAAAAVRRACCARAAGTAPASTRRCPTDAPAPPRHPPARRSRSDPVAVFGASNFPLAFSVAGGDTASALAAGCPVVVKAHDAHPGTSELVGRAITDAVADAGMPAGTFSLLFGSGPELGSALVTDPRIKAVGFTGSRSGGTALVAAAAGRPEPIPVYAEMSSINPVFLLEGALATRGADLGRAFVGSLTHGLRPVLHQSGTGHRRRRPRPRRRSSPPPVMPRSPRRAPPPMLTPGIAGTYADGVAALSRRGHLIARGVSRTTHRSSCRAALFTTDAARFLGSEALQAEVFGVVQADRPVPRRRQMRARRRAARRPVDRHRPRRRLRPRRGRAAAARSSSSRPAGSCSTAGPPGSRSATRWCTAAPSRRPPTPVPRPSAPWRSNASCVPSAYQNVPKSLLPAAIADGNPDQLWRRIDGRTHPRLTPPRSI